MAQRNKLSMYGNGDMHCFLIFSLEFAENQENSEHHGPHYLNVVKQKKRGLSNNILTVE